MTSFRFPADSLTRFCEVYDALNARRGWWADASPLRYAAVTAVLCPGTPEEVADGIRSTADEIKERAGWFSQLNSPLRFVLGAMLVQYGDTSAAFVDEVDRVRGLFRDCGLRRGGNYEAMAILLLRINNDLQPIAFAEIERFRAIYREMKRFHWWLTGPDDFPACAILVPLQQSSETIGKGIEQIYQSLADRGFTRGDQLQTAANFLYLAGQPAKVLADRFRRLTDQFTEGGVTICAHDYDELASLSFLDHSARRIVERSLAARERIETLDPKPNRSTTFSLGCSIALLELTRLNSQMKVITDASTLLSMQAIVAARQAAAVSAAVTASVVGG